MIDRIWLFHCGWIAVPRPLFEVGQPWEYPRMPFMGAVAEHRERGPILVDAPFGGEGPANVGRMTAGLLGMLGLEFQSEWSTVGRLEQIGYSASEVDDVLMTHLHVDHTGGLGSLADATTIHATDLEWEYARGQSSLIGKTRGYAPGDYRPLADRIETFEMPAELGAETDHHDVFGDGSVHAVGLPGHTVGHVGYRFEMTDGRQVLHVGDTAFTIPHVTDQRELGRFPRSFAYDVPRAEESLRALRRYHEAHPEEVLVNAHDFELGERCLDGPIEV